MAKGSKGKKSKTQNKNKKAKSKNSSGGNNNNSININNDAIDNSGNGASVPADGSFDTSVVLENDAFESTTADDGFSSQLESPGADEGANVGDLPITNKPLLKTTLSEEGEVTGVAHTEDGVLENGVHQNVQATNEKLESGHHAEFQLESAVEETGSAEPVPEEPLAETQERSVPIQDKVGEVPEEVEDPFSDFSAIALRDNIAEQDLLVEEEPATEQAPAPFEKASDNKTGEEADPSALFSSEPEANMVTRETALEMQEPLKDDVFPWDNTAEQDLMPWDNKQDEGKQDDTDNSEPLPTFCVGSDGETMNSSTDPKLGKNRVIIPGTISDSADAPIPSTFEQDTKIDTSLGAPADDDKLPWDEEENADNTSFPWNSAGASSEVEKESTLIINESANGASKDDESFLNSLSNGQAETAESNAEDKFAFLEELPEEEELLAEGNGKKEVLNKEDSTEDKFAFFEQDDDLLLDDIMDDELLEDDEGPTGPNAAHDSTANITTDTVVVSSGQEQSKYQPQQAPSNLPQNSSFLYQTNSNVFVPTQPSLMKQNFSPNILTTPPLKFAEPNQKLVSNLQQQKKKTDAYDFPQDLYLKSKPKQVKEVKQNIYTQIENSIQQPPLPSGQVTGYNQEQVTNNFSFQPPPAIGGTINRYSRSNSINSTKSSSFFAELPVPKINEKRDNLHLKNPYSLTESQSSINQVNNARRISIGSNNSISSPLMPPKRTNSYIPNITQSPQPEKSTIQQRQPAVASNLNNKFIPSKSPPSIKKPSNPYAPAAVGGHVRQISTTVTNPIDSKPNIIPVPMKSPISINSPLSPSMSVFSGNASNGAIQSNIPNSFAQRSFSSGKYAPVSSPQFSYQQQQQMPIQQQYQQQQPQFKTSAQYAPSTQMYKPPTQQGQGQPHAEMLSTQLQQQQNMIKEPQYSNGLGFDTQPQPKLNSFGKSKASVKGHKHSGSSINEVYGSTIEMSNATSTGLRKSTILPPSLSKGKHQIPHVSTLTPAPVVINPENLVRRQWPLFSFSAEDKVASMIPTFDGYSHNICNIKIVETSSILKQDNFVFTFPGPLNKTRTKKKEVSKWLEDKIESLEKSNDPTIVAEELTWKCLKLMLEKVEKPGDFMDKDYIKSIAALLNPSLNVTEAMNNTFDIIELTRLGKSFTPNKPFNSFSFDDNGFATVHQMLEVGDKKSALEFAVAEGDWAMALLISNLMGPIAFDQTIKLYATTHFQSDSMGQDLSFFVQSKSQGGFSVEQLKGKENWLVENYKIVVPFVMMDNPQYGKILSGIGEALMKAGYTAYGKLSYILSGLPLIPKSLSQLPSSIYGMIIEEIYAFALLSTGNVPPNFASGFPHMIPLKIRHGGYLADIGCSVEAKRYCDSTQASITSKLFFCEPVTLLAQNNLCDRLSQVGSGWLSSKLSRPQLDRVWTTLDKSFNKFVSGEDIPQNEPKSEGVFAKFTSPASISRTSSTLDLTEVRNSITRKPNGNPYLSSPGHIPQPIGSGSSYGGSAMVSGSRSYLPPSSMQENLTALNVSLDSISSYSASSVPHPPGPTRYTPGNSMANISSESILTTASQPTSNSTLLGQPFDENRKPNIFNPAPAAKMQYSPKAPPARTLSNTSMFNPAVKPSSSSPVANRTQLAQPPPNVNTLSTPSSLTPKSLKVSPVLQPYSQVLPQTLHDNNTIIPLEKKQAPHIDPEIAPAHQETEEPSLPETSKSVPLPPKKKQTYLPTNGEHGSVYSINESAKSGPVLELNQSEANSNSYEQSDAVNESIADTIESENAVFTVEKSLSQPSGGEAEPETKEELLEDIEPVIKSAIMSPAQHTTEVDEKDKASRTSVNDQNADTELTNGQTNSNDTENTKVLNESREPHKEEVKEDAGSHKTEEAKPSPIVSKPPPSPSKITPFRPNAGKAALRSVNRYGPSTASANKRAVNSYASMYAPKQTSPKLAYAPETDSGELAADTGIPADIPQVDMFNFGGYSTPPPPVPSTIVENLHDNSNTNEIDETESESNEKQGEDFKSEPSESRSEDNNFVPTYHPPTQMGVKSRKSPTQSEIKLANMFSPPTGFAATGNRASAVSSPLHQFTEEKRYYAQDTGEYYDDVVDEDSDDDNGAEASRKSEEEKKKLAEDAKKRKQEEEKKRREEEEEAKKKNANKGGENGRWFGWLGKGKKDDKPKPIKAKLGEENSFYYDEKLKRWINKKAPLEEQIAASAPPPPPAMKKASTTPATPVAGGPPTATPPASTMNKPPSIGAPLAPRAAKKDGIDDLLTMGNTVSARKGGRRGPRRGYVDVMAQK
ncbi:hypothetical protein PMKS-001045 [Pichia membranifaciens]|uniref:Protein transport protein sec16 n=1 Tax=Pichia membranifaciens TaxID=4926 RepID=A0A1Q2YDE8_9ASCO|nr:hypothetical protein PMKS-001045 [Pichia membranifaciens]